MAKKHSKAARVAAPAPKFTVIEGSHKPAAMRATKVRVIEPTDQAKVMKLTVLHTFTPAERDMLDTMLAATPEQQQWAVDEARKIVAKSRELRVRRFYMQAADGFCADHGISRSSYFALLADARKQETDAVAQAIR